MNDESSVRCLDALLDDLDEDAFGVDEICSLEEDSLELFRSIDSLAGASSSSWASSSSDDSSSAGSVLIAESLRLTALADDDLLVEFIELESLADWAARFDELLDSLDLDLPGDLVGDLASDLDSDLTRDEETSASTRSLSISD